MLRHLYDFALQLPATLPDSGKVAFYCNVVIVAEAYTLPGLTQEAVDGLTTLLDNMGPVFMLHSLRIITETYFNSDLLSDCADDVARKHLEKLAMTEGFSDWLTTRFDLLQDVIEDAVRGASSRILSLPEDTSVRCAKSRSSRKPKRSRSAARIRPGTLDWRITDGRLSRATDSIISTASKQLLIMYLALWG